MVKRILVITQIMITLIGVGGCTKNDRIPNLTVKVGEESINIIALENATYDLSSDPMNAFKSAFESNDSLIKYINIDEKVTLDFGDNPPNNIIIKDILLNSSGEYMYTTKEIIEVPFTNENNKYYFKVEKHMASALSSEYIESKTDFRGYLIRTYSGNNEYVYAFVIKTDSY